MNIMQVIVVGGGISGLTLALSLHQAGIAATVYEGVSEPTPLGVGINLQPTAVRELDELGLGADLARIANPTTGLSFFNKFGQPVWSEPRGIEAGYRWNQFSIHRGQLQMMLMQAARARLGAERIRTGHRLAGFEQDGDGVTVRFVDRDGRPLGAAHGAILVGADGIHSTVRRQLYPGEGAPRFAGQIMWRAAIDADPFLDGHTMVIAGHFHKRVVVYPIGPSATTPGKLLTNWIVQMTVPTDAPPREDWNRRVPRERPLAEVPDWRFDWLDMPRLIQATDEVFEFPLVDRDPVARWSFDRVTLIGDAAHPMQPTGSQAGSQAIVDARILTQALVRAGDPVAALRNYDSVRRPVMNDVTLRNRQFGPEAAMQLAEERAPNGFARIEDVIPRAELEAISRGFLAAAGLGPAEVNDRPSFVEARAAAQAGRG
jgi:2-polyprenyl-6-methoxyphenol hydroxylase-like FAD-dependent oxidoreductase